MATRSTIALEFANGVVQQVYCHWDGYLDHNGKILQEHYSDPFKLHELIKLGDLSFLGAEIGHKHHFDHSPKGQCNFYGRDRGEKGTSARAFKSYQDYLKNAQFEEYNYILRTDGKWYVTEGENVDYITLDEAFELEACAAAE